MHYLSIHKRERKQQKWKERPRASKKETLAWAKSLLACTEIFVGNAANQECSRGTVGEVCVCSVYVCVRAIMSVGDCVLLCLLSVALQRSVSWMAYSGPCSFGWQNLAGGKGWHTLTHFWLTLLFRACAKFLKLTFLLLLLSWTFWSDVRYISISKIYRGENLLCQSVCAVNRSHHISQYCYRRHFESSSPFPSFSWLNFANWCIPVKIEHTECLEDKPC